MFLEPLQVFHLQLKHRHKPEHLLLPPLFLDALPKANPTNIVGRAYPPKMTNRLLISILAAAALFSCKQGSKSPPETVEKETFYSARKYEYADANGKLLIIQNSLPRGGPYIDPNGKKYFRVMYWTQLTNETDNPLELKIDFPEDAYEVPGSPGDHYKILVPPDTVTTDKAQLYDYGMTGLKSFLDNNIHKPPPLQRTIHPKESSGFYVIFLSLTTHITPGTTMRTGLNLKGQNLFYKISRYASKPGLPLISETEVPCGSISLRNLMLKK